MKSTIFKGVFALLLAVLVTSCHKDEVIEKTFVKETTSVFDGQIITIKFDEYKNKVENSNAVNVTVYYLDVHSSKWVLINDISNVVAVVTINDSTKDVDIALNGAPIDPAVKVRIIIK